MQFFLVEQVRSPVVAAIFHSPPWPHQLLSWNAGLFGEISAVDRDEENTAACFFAKLSVKTAHEVISPFHIELSGKAIGESRCSCPFQIRVVEECLYAYLRP